VKLLRLKITDPDGFRSLQSGFEYYFRAPWELEEKQGFAPFVCAGPNGSGKSNLLEALAAIFFQLEVQRVRRNFLPSNFIYDEEANPDGFQEEDALPNGFEIEYLIKAPVEYYIPDGAQFAHVKILKSIDSTPELNWINQADFDADTHDIISEWERNFLLPQYIVGYSSGENEILSLPFFKMRFVQFDEYWNALKTQNSYPGRPETRLAYLDRSFSQAILLCNLLFHDTDTLKPFREEVGVDELKEFRIIIKRSINVSALVAEGFGENNPALRADPETGRYNVNLMQLLEKNEHSAKNFIPIVTRLKRCATCYFVDEEEDSLYLDYFVNDATKDAFRENFDFEINKSPIVLFQAFQVLLMLNLYPVSESLKRDLYKSDSHYVNETVPTLASDERIMRFKFVKFTKQDVTEPVMLKSLSDGEHQLLHSLGLCLLFRNTNSLFLLDEPDTHFNPDWRSNFISRLYQCFPENEGDPANHEMLITTHSPFLISDSKPEKVLVFKKEKVLGTVSVSKPDYNTLGASINKITMNTFGKRETIGGHAQSILDNLRTRFIDGENKEQLIAEIDKKLGDSVEKVLLIKSILDSMEESG